MKNKYLEKILSKIWQKISRIYWTLVSSIILLTLVLWTLNITQKVTELINWGINFDIMSIVITILSLLLSIFISIIQKIENNIGNNKTEEQKKSKDKMYADHLKTTKEDILSIYLREISNEIGFGNEQRICVYDWEGKKKKLQRSGRHAEHDYHRENISFCWYEKISCLLLKNSEEFFCEKKIPNPKGTKGLEAYQKYLFDKYGISKKESKKFPMKTIEFFACRIKNSESKTIAMLIFESTKKNVLQKEKILCFCKNKNDTIVNLIRTLEGKPVRFNRNTAKKEGL